MRVVSNTSTLSNLAVIGRLDLLKERYGQVRIPMTVSKELLALKHVEARKRLDAALADGWLVVDGTSLPTPALPFALDAGETDAIALALAVNADILLMDEKRGRQAARQTGLKVAGVLGELLHARQAGRIPNLRQEIARLRSEAGAG